VITCPFCKRSFPEALAKQDAFELFHALRDEYAEAQGMHKVEAKDTLCVLWGVSREYGDYFVPPKWPGVFCALWGRRFFRKSTLAYTPREMSKLIEGTEESIHVKEEA
jgi:hypothetical protein